MRHRNASSGRAPRAHPHQQQTACRCAIPSPPAGGLNNRIPENTCDAGHPRRRNRGVCCRHGKECCSRKSLMPAHVLYEVPMATWPVRLLMIAVCGLFVLAIYGWWLPRVLSVLRNLPAMRGGQALTTVVVALLPLVIGVGPLLVLIALIRNPIAYV